MRLHPDDPADPYVFRIDMADLGKPTLPVVFARRNDGRRPVDRLCFGEMVFHKRTSSHRQRRQRKGAP